MDQILTLVHVAIPRPLRTPLSYRLPEGFSVEPGMRVVVPLGKLSCVGVVLAVEDAVPSAEFEIKPIDRVLDAVPMLDAAGLALLQWAARYYHCAVGEALFTALPVALRKAKPLSKQYQQLLAPSHPRNVGEVVDSLRLTSSQQQCLHNLQIEMAKIPPRPVLLHGITGSGKTEIYLRLLLPLLAAGKQALVIVPEIGLTPQLVARFQQFFRETPMVCLHSGLSDGERLTAWLQARRGEAKIIIGTRSAVFTPAPALGVIIVDEEHDASLKQQDGFRYHGRDLAVKRAKNEGIPVILGSATPSLESLYNVQQGRYHYFRLDQRPGTARPPLLQVQDTRPFELQAGLTPSSLQAIRRTLECGEQAMVFLNRRGFAPALYCPSCGWQASCAHCSVNMTWHARRNRLVCHHCGAEQATPMQCPSCHNPKLTTQGQGTERLELVLQTHFPRFPVIRIDRDSTSRKGALEDKLTTVRSNDPMILVGTQMLAKGHDFPNLTLVVIMDIDHALLSTDYRAVERLGQLLVQVAGRAGRAQKPGQVILQTSQPKNPLLNQLVGHGYAPFARYLLAERQRWHFPPYGYHALIRADAKTLEQALHLLEHLSAQLATTGTGIQRLGPVPAPLEKRANRYRAQLLVGSQQRTVLHSALDALLNARIKVAGCSGVRWSIDVDPLDFS